MVEVILRNNSDQVIKLYDDCVFTGVFAGSSCTGTAVYGPSCAFSETPLEPGQSHVRSWVQTDDQGNPVPPGQYWFEITYTDENYEQDVHCCVPVTISSSCIPSVASAVPRNGSGSNPSTLASVYPPELGWYWDTSLDCSAHAPGLAHLFVYNSPASGVPGPYGELLVGGVRILRMTQPHAGAVVSFSAAVPLDVALCGVSAYSQGLCGGAPGRRLSNALDLVLGTHPQ